MITKAQQRKTKYKKVKQTAQKVQYTELISSFAFKKSKGEKIDIINYPNVYSKLYGLNISKFEKKDSTLAKVGLCDIEYAIKDLRSFVRLYISAETWNCFRLLQNHNSLKIIACIVDNLMPNETNEIVINKSLYKNYRLTKDSYYDALNDCLQANILIKRTKQNTYIVNPNIFSCGDVKDKTYIVDDVIKKRKISFLSADKNELKRKGIDSNILNEFVDRTMVTTTKKKEVGIYAVSEDKECKRPFFKLYRNKFSNGLLELSRLSSIKVLAYLVCDWSPEKDDRATMNCNTVCEALNISKSTYYRARKDLLNSGILYKAVEDDKLYFNPNDLYSGSAIKLIDKRIRTSKERRKDGYENWKKRRLIEYVTEYLR